MACDSERSGPSDYSELSCRACRHGEALGFDFSMAFQPIVDAAKQQVLGYEALCRGVNGEGAAHILVR